MVSVPPAQVAIDASVTGEVVRVIGILECQGMSSYEFRLDGVEPGGISRQVDGLHVATSKEVVSGPPIGR